MKRKLWIRRVLRRFFLRLFFYPVIVVIVSVLYLNTFGFPRAMLMDILERIPDPNFTIEAEAARIDLLHGLVLEDVSIFRKRVLGPPAAEAKTVRVGFHPLISWKRGNWTSKLSIFDGVLRPSMLLSGGQASGEWSGKETEMDVQVERCTIYGILVERLSFTLFSNSRGIQCEGVSGSLRNEDWQGPISGEVSFDPMAHACRGNLQMELDPHLLQPLLLAWEMDFAVELINRFQFNEKPTAHVDFKRVFDGETQTFDMKCHFDFSDGSYRRVQVQSANGDFLMHWAPGDLLITVDPVHFSRPEGSASGSFSIDARSGLVTFDGFSSGIGPRELTQLVGILDKGEWDPWKFRGPLSLRAKGHANYVNLEDLQFEAAFEGSNLWFGQLEATSCAFTMKMQGLTNMVSDIRGTIYGGDFGGDAVFMLAPWDSTNEPSYAINGWAKNADFEKTIKAITGEGQSYSGKMSGRAGVHGILNRNRLETMAGQGNIAVSEGRVFQLPVFGGLSAIMAHLIPGLDFVLRQSDVSMDFEIADSAVITDRVLVEGDVLSLSAHGRYMFDGRLDFNAQVKLMKEHTLVAKILQAITYPISKLFEFHVTGTLGEPRWYPVNFSRDLLEKIGFDKN